LVSYNATDFIVLFLLGIVSRISSFKFVAYLFILHDILKVVNILSIQLQSKSATLENSANLIKGLIDTLQSRSFIHYSELWEKNGCIFKRQWN